jgi:hypothetical protein
MAFAVAVQAGDGKTCQAKDQAGCSASKTKTSLQASDAGEHSCCSAKMKTSLQAKDSEKPSCSAGKMKTSLEANGTEKSSCCASKMKTSITTDEATCPFAKAACCKKKQVKQTALLSPKASEWVK